MIVIVHRLAGIVSVLGSRGRSKKAVGVRHGSMDMLQYCVKTCILYNFLRVQGQICGTRVKEA